MIVEERGVRTVVASVDIPAPPATVWAVLTDFPRHPEWNPFIRSISGPLVKGETLEIHVQPPGSKGMRFRPRLLDVAPGRELRWKGKLLVPGLFDGEHYFILAPTADGTRLHHGEQFSGILAKLTPVRSFEPIEAGFHAMNDALAARSIRQEVEWSLGARQAALGTHAPASGISPS
jgi:hypothetical protein